MSLSIQAKFLRVLEGHPFERVGGHEAINVDVRVVAATNRDLELAIHEKLFRKDLYFRLFVVEVTPLPLREHSSDIPVLANYFLHRFAKRLAGRCADSRTMHWNCCVSSTGLATRELQNCVERAVVLSTREMVSASEIKLSGLRISAATVPPPTMVVPTGVAEGKPPAALGETVKMDKSLDQLEQQHILATLEKTNWNKSQTAAILGIERSTLDRKLKRYGVNRPD